MCRHLAYLGPPATLAEIVLDPPHSLERQSYAPQEQKVGRVNADGFGVGWYDTHMRPEPARYRTHRPIWADRSFASIAPLIRSTAIVASVRSATPPNPVEESGVQPFTSGPWLFCHNGLLEGWPADRADVVRGISEERAAAIEGATDSEALFALTLDHLDAGATPSDALKRIIDRFAPQRLNLLLGDGSSLVATRVGSSLSVLQRDGAIVIASEPFDGDGGWEAVPDGSLVEARRGCVHISTL